MKALYLIMVFLFFAPFTMVAGLDVRIFTEKKDNQINFFVDNDEWCSVSIAFDFELKNMKSSHGSKFTLVIPARTRKFPGNILTTHKINELFGYKYKTNIVRGDVISPKNTDYTYELPYPIGKKYTVMQGYNGQFSHKGSNALDFSLAEGDEICAARSGVIVEVVQHNNRRCTSPGCDQYNNFVLVCQEDGTFAEYAHIKKDGSLVAPGDTIASGQIIALSGDVGFASGPHLHFVVSLPGLNGNKSIRTLFRTRNNEAEFLKEGVSYLRTDNN